MAVPSNDVEFADVIVLPDASVGDVPQVKAIEASGFPLAVR